MPPHIGPFAASLALTFACLPPALAQEGDGLPLPTRAVSADAAALNALGERVAEQLDRDLLATDVSQSGDTARGVYRFDDGLEVIYGTRTAEDLLFEIQLLDAPERQIVYVEYRDLGDGRLTGLTISQGVLAGELPAIAGTFLAEGPYPRGTLAYATLIARGPGLPSERAMVFRSTTPTEGLLTEWEQDLRVMLKEDGFRQRARADGGFDATRRPAQPDAQNAITLKKHGPDSGSLSGADSEMVQLQIETRLMNMLRYLGEHEGARLLADPAPGAKPLGTKKSGMTSALGD